MEDTNSNQQKPLDVLILAAGLGTRMRSNLAKVLHLLDGSPLINHVCRTASALGPRKIYVVVGHQREEVKSAVWKELDQERVEFVWQKEQLGTGDAVNSAREFLETEDSTLLVLSGDVPLIRAETLAAMIQQHHSHRGRGAACTILTVKLSDPSGYGRVLRDEKGLFEEIVEHKDASEDQKLVSEINTGIYCFETLKLFQALSAVGNNNSQSEFYLTDVPRLLRNADEDVSLYRHTDSREVSGVNNRFELSEMERIVNRRTISRLMLDYGVSFVDPNNVYVSEQASIGRDTLIYPNVSIEGETMIGDGCLIRSGTRIANSKIGHGVEILDNCLITEAEIANDCKIGPFAHIRPKTKLEEKAKIGNYVEVKNTTVGRNSKANHLTYLGDATIGENTNIGAGTITCNFDGINKHKTKIGDNVKIGSDTMLIAPIEIGDGAVTGAGSIVTKDVPPNKLAVGAPARLIKTLKED